MPAIQRMAEPTASERDESVARICDLEWVSIVGEGDAGLDGGHRLASSPARLYPPTPEYASLLSTTRRAAGRTWQTTSKTRNWLWIVENRE